MTPEGKTLQFSPPSLFTGDGAIVLFPTPTLPLEVKTILESMLRFNLLSASTPFRMTAFPLQELPQNLGLSVSKYNTSQWIMANNGDGDIFDFFDSIARSKINAYAVLPDSNGLNFEPLSGLRLIRKVLYPIAIESQDTQSLRTVSGVIRCLGNEKKELIEIILTVLSELFPQQSGGKFGFSGLELDENCVTDQIKIGEDTIKFVLSADQEAITILKRFIQILTHSKQVIGGLDIHTTAFCDVSTVKDPKMHIIEGTLTSAATVAKINAHLDSMFNTYGILARWLHILNSQNTEVRVDQILVTITSIQQQFARFKNLQKRYRELKTSETMHHPSDSEENVEYYALPEYFEVLKNQTLQMMREIYQRLSDNQTQQSPLSTEQLQSLQRFIENFDNRVASV